jgi:hypothetical protein
MRYDERASRLVAVVSSKLDALTAANTVGHLLVALGASVGPGLLGDHHLDSSGSIHSPIARFPLIIKAAKSGTIRAAVARARAAGLAAIDYPEEGFATTHDHDYRDALAGRREQDLVYIGAAFFGPTEAVNEVCGKFMLWAPTT